MSLYKCELECKVKGLPDKVEFLRAKNENILTTMFENCEKHEGSTYYGYKWNSVCVMKMKDFPEVMTVMVDI